MLEPREKIEAAIENLMYPLPRICEIDSPFGFLCLAAMIDYFATAAYRPPSGKGKGSGADRYTRFVVEFMPRYAAFRYRDPTIKLPEQMYFLLRCGLVHSFSLVPGEREKDNGARKRSIVLGHQINAKGRPHLDHYSQSKGIIVRDAAYFLCEEFCTDTMQAVRDLLSETGPGEKYWPRVQAHFSAFPPIGWLGSW